MGPYKAIDNLSLQIEWTHTSRDCHGCDKPVRVTGRVVTGGGQGTKFQPAANPYPTHGFPGSKTGMPLKISQSKTRSHAIFVTQTLDQHWHVLATSQDHHQVILRWCVIFPPSSSLRPYLSPLLIHRSLLHLFLPLPSFLNVERTRGTV